MHKIGVCLFSLCLALAACSSSQAKRAAASLSTLPLNPCEAITNFLTVDLNHYQDAVDAASADYQREQWKVETADPTGSEEKMSKLFEVMQEKTYDKDILAKAKALKALTQNLSQAKCPLKKSFLRADELIETTILSDPKVIAKEKENQDKQDALTAKSNAFRMNVPGEKEPISRALYTKKLNSTKDRAEREKLYHEFNSKRADQWLAWGFKDLLKSRNEEGQLAGYKNYYDYRFYRNQLDLPNFLKMVQEVKTKLAPKLRQKFKELGDKEGIDQIEGWDLGYLREQNAAGDIDEIMKNLPASSALDIAKAYYSGSGNSSRSQASMAV